MARLVLICMFAAMATGMFVIKNRVIGLENELASINSQMLADQKALHVLKAEWTYLNNPERIRDLSSRHAKMKPITGDQIISVSSIPFKFKQPETGLIRVSYAPSATRE